MTRTGTITFLFTDIEGSTRRWQDDPSMADTLTRHDEILREAVTTCEGDWVKHTGDGVLAVFASATSAVEAAVEAQRALSSADWGERPLRVRMGLHTGEAAERDGDYFGPAVNAAARIMDAANGGQVLVSDATRGLVEGNLPEGVELRDLGEHRLKDLERSQRLCQLHAPGLAGDFPPLRTLEGTPNNLPVQPMSFVGRQQELAEVAKLLGANRLLTLTGVGGSGKTRLALQAAAGALEDYPDGVWFIELAPLADPQAVPHEVARVLALGETAGEEASTGRPIEERLVSHLHDKQLLLVLNNCEHLLGAAGSLADVLLRSCLDVRILATSREGLGIGGETIWQVPSLSLPDPDLVDDLETDAERLFSERAQAVAQSFVLNHKTRPAVVQICRRLDGIPLAIELAAGRVKLLGVEGLAGRLDDRFRILTGGSRTALPRQQTLEATIDWSYELLDPDERSLFARLSVFVGGFSMEDAEAVCSGDGLAQEDVLDLLSRLVDKSLVATEQREGAVRYRMLETTRAYAAHKLADLGGAKEVRRRHRDRYLHVAEAAEQDLPTDLGAVTLPMAAVEPDDPLDPIRDNLESALAWSLDSDDDDEASRLAALLARYWRRRKSRFGRVVEYLHTALDRNPPGSGPEREARLRTQLSGALQGVGDLDGAMTEAERAATLLREAAPSSEKVFALLALTGATMQHVGQEPQRAIEPARDAVDVARSVEDPLAEAVALGVLGFALGLAGDPHEGAEQIRGALSIADAFQHEAGIMTAYSALFHLELAQARRTEEVRRLVDEVVARFEADPDRWADHMPWLYLGYAFLQLGTWDRADDAVDRMARSGPEGGDRMGLYHVRGLLRWMQGRLDEALADVEAWGEMGVYTRWYHDYYSLACDVASEDGRLDDVRTFADEYLAVDLTPGEQAMKVGVLRPVIRAEVEAALRTEGEGRDEHIRNAREALDRMRDIFDRFPPVDWRQVESPEAQALLAEAELSRITGPDPKLWRTIAERAFMAYWKLYARLRLAEALLATDQRDDGAAELRAAYDKAVELGAGRIRDEAETLADRHGIGSIIT